MHQQSSPRPVTTWIIGLFVFGTLLVAGEARAQSGCCQYAFSNCQDSSDPTGCSGSGGQFFNSRGCDATSGLCSTQRLRRPPVRPQLSRTRPLRSGAINRPVLPVRPHGPHVTLVPAPLATPTPAPTTNGCCQLPSSNGAPLCSSFTDDFACISSGGVFVPGSSCDRATNRCNPGPDLGCCQLGTVSAPFCAANANSTTCSINGGTFVSAGLCTGSGFCAAPAPRCGNGLIERGEECEADRDCGANEGCTDTCQCAGAVEVLLRWTNQNDLNLTVIDPRGNVYAPSRDANRECVSATNKPEEFVYLPPGRAPIGCYLVRAEYHRQCPAAGIVDTHIDLRLNVEGYKSTVHDVPGPVEGETFETTFGVRASCF